MLDENGNFPEIEKPMIVDAHVVHRSAAWSAPRRAARTSSRRPASAKGRGPASRRCRRRLLFALSLFFIPLVEPLQPLRFAYGPALIAVGALMLGRCARIDFDDLTELVPAFATIVMMVFTYNIANGLTAGLLASPGHEGGHRPVAGSKTGIDRSGGAVRGVLRVRTGALSVSS